MVHKEQINHRGSSKQHAKRHTVTPQHLLSLSLSLSPLKGNKGPGLALQTLEDFSKFTYTGVNLKGLLPGMQNWATVQQRQYLMQHASEENKSICCWLHRTFKIYYKQILKSFNEIPELNSPAQPLTGLFCTLWHHSIPTLLAVRSPELNVKWLHDIHCNSQAVHKHRFVFIPYRYEWFHQLRFIDLRQPESQARNLCS